MTNKKSAETEHAEVDSPTPTPAGTTITIPPIQVRLPGRGGLGLVGLLLLGVGSAGAAGGVYLIPEGAQAPGSETPVEHADATADEQEAVDRALLERRVTRLEDDSARIQAQLSSVEHNVQGIDYDVGLLCKHFGLPCQDGVDK